MVVSFSLKIYEMRKLILSLAFLAVCTFGTAQDNFNIELISQTDLGETGNDVWGWVDSTGVEYAIMGSQTNTWVFSLEDPAAPNLRIQIPGDGSTWRDIKSWEDHLYVTTDSGNDGLLVIDMSMAPDSIRFQYINPLVIAQGDTTVLTTCHNLYIDENGFCYLAGCRAANADKAVILDLNQDKWTPPIVGAHGTVPGGGGYAHDLYVKNNILYASEIYQGQLGIYDVSQKDSLVLLGTTPTGFSFTHNAWTSTDQNYVFTTDERANAFVEAYDISDPQNIQFLDAYQPLETVGRGVIPHNTHYYDGFLVTSYYTDGLVITDVNKPDNMIKVGAFDTFLGPDGGFNGCWGAYPYLPSGLVLASDRSTGLYVFDVNYVQAARMEGTVMDIADGTPINNVEVTIKANQVNYDFSSPDGSYKTGIAEQGLFEVYATHPEYKMYKSTVELINGEVVIKDIFMEKIQIVNYNVSVVDDETGEPIPGAHVTFDDLDASIVDAQTDDFGLVNEMIPARVYLLSAGVWGYETGSLIVDAEATNTYEFRLTKAYKDGFLVDLGWQSEGNAATGQWERAKPIGTQINGFQVAPSTDAPQNSNMFCYVTENSNSGSHVDGDIDDGYVELISPYFSVEGMLKPTISFNAWFSIGGGATEPNDTMYIYLYEDDQIFELMRISEITDGWSESISIDITDFITNPDSLRVSFYGSDLPDSGHVLELAVDNFAVTDTGVSSIEDITKNNFSVSPNPFLDQFNIEFEQASLRKIMIYNALGQMVYNQKHNSTNVNIALDSEPGIYVLSIENEDGKVATEKIIKN